VNVVPLSAPKSAYKFKPAPGSAWNHTNIYGTDIYIPWNSTVFAPFIDTILANASSDRFMCYGVWPVIPSDTIDEFTTTNDPVDPIFYSTCYYKYSGNTFADYDEYPGGDTTVSVPWKYQTQCIDCASQSINSHSDVTPVWKIAETCVNCDLFPVDAPLPEKTPTYQIENATHCDGLPYYIKPAHTTCPNNATQALCNKQLYPIGRDANDDVSLDECRLLATQDSQCSNVYTVRIAPPFRCYCYTNIECCLGCARIIGTSFATYEHATTPDPTCATGVLSATGVGCCSGSCAKCITTNGGTDDIGFCTVYGITRPCDKFGPPCLLGA
jgi:hypothetical protein